MAKSVLLVAGVAALVVALVRRRQSRMDAALWREATSDSAR